MISKESFLTLMFIWTCHGDTFDMARVVGGNDADFDKWKFVVAIYKQTSTKVNSKQSKYNYYCAGVIINKWHVLTVAHCLISVKEMKEIIIQSGTTIMEYEINVIALDKKYFVENGLQEGKLFRYPRKLK